MQSFLSHLDEVKPKVVRFNHQNPVPPLARDNYIQQTRRLTELLSMKKRGFCMPIGYIRVPIRDVKCTRFDQSTGHVKPFY